MVRSRSKEILRSVTNRMTAACPRAAVRARLRSRPMRALQQPSSKPLGRHDAQATRLREDGLRDRIARGQIGSPGSLNAKLRLTGHHLGCAPLLFSARQHSGAGLVGALALHRQAPAGPSESHVNPSCGRFIAFCATFVAFRERAPQASRGSPRCRSSGRRAVTKPPGSRISPRVQPVQPHLHLVRRPSRRFAIEETDARQHPPAVRRQGLHLPGLELLLHLVTRPVGHGC